MKKIIILISIITIPLFTVITSINAQLPNQTKKESTKYKQIPQTDQRGSDQFPMVVKVIPPKITAEEATADKKERKEKQESDWWLVRLTAVLAFIGALQVIVFGWQARRLRQSVEATKEAADAAKKSADALSASERAYIFVEVEYGCKNPKPHVRDFDFQVFLRNHGKTPAIVSHARYSIIKADKVPKTEADLIGIEYHHFEPCIIIESGGFYCKEIPSQLTEEETKQIWSQNKMMLCWVQIAYVDIFGIQHTPAFCWRYDIDKKKFVIADTPLNVWA